MTSIPKVFLFTLVSVLNASALYLFLNHWGVDFKFPLIRSPKNRSGWVYVLPASMNILIFYILVGYLILFGLSIPLVPSSTLKLSSFELAIAGIAMVALVRVLTLLNSIRTFRILINALVLSWGFSTYVAFLNFSIVNEAVLSVTRKPVTGVQDFTHIVTLPIVALVVMPSVELFWFILIKKRRSLITSVAFIKSLQSDLEVEEIGYGRDRIHEAYFNVIRQVSSSEGIWELCWISSMGAQLDFYETLIDSVAARIGIDTGAIISYLDFFSLHDGDEGKMRFRERARTQLEDVGMFLIQEGENDAIDQFKQNMGFYPGTFRETVLVEFIIINRRVGVISWPSHNLRYTFGRYPAFQSTMFSKLTRSSRINIYLKLFDSLWGNYLMNKTGLILSGLPEECILLLDIVIDRSGLWTQEELLDACNRRYEKIFSKKDLQMFLSHLIDNKVIKVVDGDFLQRVPNIQRWQERWLRIHR